MSCDVVLADLAVSRRHRPGDVVRFGSKSEYRVESAELTNATFVD